MPASRDDAKTVIINGLRYPLAAPVERQQLAYFVRKFTVGDAQYDSDDYQSALILSNLSGGIGIEDSDEGADTTRFWFGVADSRSPRMLALPPLVTQTKPGGASGTCRPLGVIGTQFYAQFGTTAWGWNDTTGDWHSAGVDYDFAAVNKPVLFDGRVWIPQGANGTRSVTETNAATGATTEANITATPEAQAFAVWDNCLYAIATDGDLWKLVQGSTTWATVTNSAGVQLKVQTGETPKSLVVYYNRTGESNLWLITDRAAHQYYQAGVEWKQSNIKFPPHPDFGRSACVWRTGEDLWISAASDIVRQTTGNAIVPLASGLSRDQGLPQEYRGTIYDLEPEISNLFAITGPTAATGSTSISYSSKFGTDGSGNDNFNTPKQIAIDSNGDIYIADFGNDRLKRHSSGGVFEANLVTSVDEITGVAVDASLNVYIVFKNAASDYRIRKYNSSGTLQWTVTNVATSNDDPIGHIATDGTHVYYTTQNNHRVVKITCASGAYAADWGGSGSGDGQFSTPYGIAYNSVTGSIVVVDQGNDRIQEFTTAGVFVRKWGSSGSGNGQFQTATGIACHPSTGDVYVADSGRDDVQVFSAAGAWLRTFGSTGTGNGNFAIPDGIAVDASSNVWVSDTQAGDDRIQKFVQTTSSGSGTTAYPTLQAWPGTGWHCLWAGTVNTVTPTWMMVSAPTAHYRLWWGMDDGYAYFLKLYRGFENVNQAREAGSATFAAGGGEVNRSGFLLTSKFDAGMLGFTKLASHVAVIPVLGSISATETITIEFDIDDGGWETLGTLSSNAETHYQFGTTGRTFNTIRFRLSMARGSTTTRSPMLRSLTFLFNKIPQSARSLVFTVVPPTGDVGSFGNRSGQDMFQELEDLCAGVAFYTVTYNGLTFNHCRIASTTGHDNLVDPGGKRVISVIELPTGV